MSAGSGYHRRLFTIAPTRPFLPVLARALVEGRLVPGFSGADPLALAGATILLPTRRAARGLQAALLEATGRRATLLPQIRPIGDIDEDLGELTRALLAEAASDDTVLPTDRPMPPFARDLALARLVLAWRGRLRAALAHPVSGKPVAIPSTVTEAVHLAKALGGLMDQVAAEGVGWAGLAGLAPAEHARYWELSLEFLKIVTEHWPAFLAERGLEDPGIRRDRLIRAEAARLAAHPPAGPMIVAGSTGSVPATAALIRAVSRLEHGAVVLPGLDLAMDDASWDAIDATAVSHPQYGLKLLLDRLDATRAHVADLAPETEPATRARLWLIGEAMRPAGTTERWAASDFRPNDVALATRGLALLEARNEGEEALAVAVALRGAIADGRTAALVTPDRNLARRVSVELTRFGLEVDDSAGQPLGSTAPATLARLIADIVLGGWNPVGIAALLHHPMARFGLPAAAARAAARTVELMALRGPRIAPGIAGLAAAFDIADTERAEPATHPPMHRVRLGDPAVRQARDLIRRLDAALAPLTALEGREAPLAAWLAAHGEALAAVVRDEAGSDAPLSDDEQGAALVAALADLLAAAREPDGTILLPSQDYPAAFLALTGDVSVRRAGGTETRIHIWGPLEARLQTVDRLILGGLSEGVWPQGAHTDPWLSRPMKAGLGLEAPERRIGLAAHDMAQGLGHGEVILTRPLKAGGAPTVPSRWLQRLAAVMGPEATAAARGRARIWLDLAATLDRPRHPPQPVARPAPCPPVEARPTRLSVTEIETWIRDPYAIHARHILKLEPLDPIGASPDASERGNIVHRVMARFVAEAGMPADLGDVGRFETIAAEELVRLSAFPAAVALWRLRLKDIGRWMAETEPERSRRVKERDLERTGRHKVAGTGFTLSGRLDRLDLLADGTVRIVDYKTGTPPSSKQVRALLAPQLPLEAMMAQAGAFGDTPRGRSVSELAYAHLKGGQEGGRWMLAVTGTPTDPPPSFNELAELAGEKLAGLAALYARPETTYPSRPRIAFEKRLGGPYDHLARVAEWSVGQGEDEDGGEA